MQNPTNHIFAHTPETLQSWCLSHNMPAFRVTQILEWVYAKGITDPQLMSNLSKYDRDILTREMVFESAITIAHPRNSTRY